MTQKCCSSGRADLLQLCTTTQLCVASWNKDQDGACGDEIFSDHSPFYTGGMLAVYTYIHVCLAVLSVPENATKRGWSSVYVSPCEEGVVSVPAIPNEGGLYLMTVSARKGGVASVPAPSPSEGGVSAVLVCHNTGSVSSVHVGSR